MIAREELMAAAIARLILDPDTPPVRHIAVGAATPIPAAACWLAKFLGHDVRLSLLHRQTGKPLTAGTRELFDLAGQGRIDLFFLGGGQIDGQANINLIGTGEWPGTKVRFPGSFGSAFMYLMVPRTILFREEHSRRVLVPRVDIISAPGILPPCVFRRGHAQALVTGRCVFSFDPADGRFTLRSIHPDETLASIAQNTGFSYETDSAVTATQPPSPGELDLLSGPVCQAMRETYPAFCQRVWGTSR